MIKQILVPTDFSEPSLDALDYAIGLAQHFHARITIISVVDPIEFVVPGDIYAPMTNRGILTLEQRQIAQEHLASAAKRVEKRGVKAQTLLSTGTPYQHIIEAAGKIGADLIVMATHGRSGLSHFLLGSVAEKVVRTAPCPVLTIRPAKPKSPRRKRSPAKTDRK